MPSLAQDLYHGGQSSSVVFTLEVRVTNGLIFVERADLLSIIAKRHFMPKVIAFEPLHAHKNND